MVRAILAGGKTQTRRIVNPQPDEDGLCKLIDGPWHDTSARAYRCPYGHTSDLLWVKETWKPDPAYGLPPSTRPTEIPQGTHILYRATLDPAHPKAAWQAWRPCLFMMQWMSRITLEITSVRGERLQDISEEDAIAEGIERIGQGWKDYGHPANSGKVVLARDSYRSLWNSINLRPSPVYARGEDGKKSIVAYESYPWSAEDFDVTYPSVRVAGLFRGKPLTVTANPWVWVIKFKRDIP